MRLSYSAFLLCEEFGLELFFGIYMLLDLYILEQAQSKTAVLHKAAL